MSTSLAGSTIGRFRVGRLLGKGGMGSVYSAFDEKLERDVALKVLHEEGESAMQRKRLLREARIAAKLQHPNIATIYEVEELDGNLYIVMELLEGVSLRRALHDRRFGLDEAIAIGRDVARALARAHAAGVVHRDIKPENVFLTTLSADTTIAKVLDFGLARQKPPVSAEAQHAEQTNTNTTSRGDVWGTPGYVSPEQALGQQVDLRTDLFSFGVVFYEMLANIRPFRGESAVATMIATTRTEPRSLTEIVPNLPPEIDAIVKRCLQKKKHDRYEHGGELSAALEAFARSGGAAHSVRMPSIGSSPSYPHIAPPPRQLPNGPIHGLSSGEGDAPTTGSAALSMSTREEASLAMEEQRRDRIRLFAAVTVGFVLALVALVLIVTIRVPTQKKSAVAANEAAAPPPSVAMADEPAPEPVSEPVAEPAATLEPTPEPPAPVAVPPAPIPHPVAPRPAPPPAAAAAGSGKKQKPADCVKPFNVDAKGVKIPKLYCL